MRRTFRFNRDEDIDVPDRLCKLDMPSQRARNVSPKAEIRRLNYDDITYEDTSFNDNTARLQTGGLDKHIDMTPQGMVKGNSEPKKKTMCESAMLDA